MRSSSTEKRAIEIVASVQKETSLAVSTHCDKGTMAIEQGKLLEQFGVQPEKWCLAMSTSPTIRNISRRFAPSD